MIGINITCPCGMLMLGQMPPDAGRLALACTRCRTLYEVAASKIEMPPEPALPPWQCVDCDVMVAGSDRYCWNCRG